jgi:PAS domain S-box-containing protein
MTKHEEPSLNSASPEVSDESRGGGSPAISPPELEALRENRLLLSLALKSSRMGVWERDIVAGTVWWSEELEEIFGLTKGSFGGTEKDFFDLIVEADRESAGRAVETALAERRDYSFEFRFRHASGEIRWMEGRGEAIYSERGEPLKIYGTGIDITDRKRAEEKYRFLAQLDRTVQQIAEPDEVMSVTARMLAEHLGADRCAYAEIEDEHTFVVTGDYTCDVPSIVGRWPLEAFGREFVRRMFANEPFVVADADADPRVDAADLPAYRAAAIRAVICVPLHKEGKFTAGIAVHQSVPRVWTADEIELVEQVVGRCWESIERTRAARATRLSDERFRLALSSGAVTVYEQDAELRYKWVFPTTPYSPNLIGKTDSELSPGAGASAREEMKRRVLETGETLRGEVPAVVGGTERWYDLLIEPRYDDTGKIVGIGGTALDITDRKVLEASYLASQERFRALVEQAPFSIQLLDMQGRTLSVNRAFEELWGLNLDQLSGYNILDDPQLEPSGVAAGLRRAFAGETLELPELPYDPNQSVPGVSSSNPDAIKWTTAVAYPLRSPDGELREIALVHRDITEKKRAEDRLEQQKTLLERLTESVLDGILIVSPDRKLLHFNQRFLDIWNFPPEVLELGSDDSALAWAAQQTVDPASFLARVNHIYSHSDTTFREEMPMKDGRVYERFGAPVNHGDTRLGWVWTFRDITERKRLEEALARHGEELEATVRQRTRELSDTNKGLKIENRKRKQLEAERLKLLAAITTVQEDERRRIALDLHDQLGQQLTALKFRIELLRLRRTEDGFEKLIAEAQELVRRIDDDVDALSWGLRPPSLDDIGLVASLADYVNEWSRRFEIPVKFRTARFGKKRLPLDSETNLYRITQEILTNICKHARASSVDITLEKRQGRVMLTVLDDGIGFVPMRRKSRQAAGMGLVGMRERAAIMGGSMNVESEPGKGTLITVNIPVSAARQKKIENSSRVM